MQVPYRRATLFVLILILATCAPALAADKYVSTTGNNTTGDGSEATPWKTISYSCGQLSAGDTLHITAGTYDEEDEQIELKYSAKDNITLIGEGGEVLIHKNHDITWEVHDATKGIYKSTGTYTSSYTDNTVAHGFFEYDDDRYKLVTYPTYAQLSSTKISEYQEYAGPGTFWDKAGDLGTAGKIYIRLTATEQMGWCDDDGEFDLTNFPSNPSNLTMHITVTPPLLFVWKADNVTLQGITIENGSVSIGGGTATKATIRDVKILGAACKDRGRVNMKALNLAYVDDVLVDNFYIDDYLPRFQTWEDTKTWIAWEVYSISSFGSDLTIRNSTFRRVTDGVNTELTQGHNIKVYNNTFEEVRDDCQEISSCSYDVEVYNNRSYKTFSAFTRTYVSTANPYPGRKYIHHNLIDTSYSYFRNRRRSDDTFGGTYVDEQGRGGGIVFVIHAGEEMASDGDPRHYYNNTILTGGFKTNIAGVRYVWVPTGGWPTTTPQTLYNNIFYVEGDSYITMGEKSDPTDHSIIFDGNCHFRDGGTSDDPLYYNMFSDDTGDIFSLDDLIDGSDDEWEADGVYEDPTFDSNYHATNSDAWDGGKDISSLGLPGVDGTYRGCFKGAIGNTFVPEPVIFNAGFESELGSEWAISGVSAISRDSTVSQRGSYSLKIVGPSSGTSTYSVTSPFVAAEAGRDYTAKVNIKGSGITSSRDYGACIKMIFKKKDGSTIQWQTTFEDGTFDWKLITLTKTAPTDTVQVCVTLRLYDGPGTVWYDNLSLTTAPNWVPDGGFEADHTPHWDTSAGTWSRDTAKSYLGKYSMKVVTTSAGPAAGTTVLGRIPVTASKKYVLSGYAKGDTVQTGTGALIKVQFYDSTDTYITQHQTNTDDGTFDWKLLTKSGTVPTNATSAKVSLRLYGSGTVWFDEVHLYLEE
jgi:Carbohydrate binding domain